MGIYKKIILYSAVLIIGGLSAFVSTPYLRQFLTTSGLIQEEILIAGTGSMYPTFPKGEGTTDVVRAQETVAWPKMRHFPHGVNLFGMSLFSYKLERGDIVNIENEMTKELSRKLYGEEAGFVKRIVALPGDTIMLRDGYAIVNGQTLDEPYTAKPRSTFGGENLADCQNIELSADKVFVMGDNRKASQDSRFELGLVDVSDIKYVMPVDEQVEYTKSYRDTREDVTFANTATLDSETFVRLLNAKRMEKNLSPYKLNNLLSLSSKRRGNTMITTDDFSTEATRSGVTLARAIKEAGYKNIIFAEIFTRGYYEANELLENFLEFPQTAEILFSGQYQEIGLSPVLGEINGCPLQVVVVHLGGYVPPNYSTENLESWKKLLDNLNAAIPSWDQFSNVSTIDQNKLSQLLVILRRRQDAANKIYNRMKVDQWLTDEEENLASQDSQLASEANTLINELNKK